MSITSRVFCRLRSNTIEVTARPRRSWGIRCSMSCRRIDRERRKLHHRVEGLRPRTQMCFAAEILVFVGRVVRQLMKLLDRDRQHHHGHPLVPQSRCLAARNRRDSSLAGWCRARRLPPRRPRFCTALPPLRLDLSQARTADAGKDDAHPVDSQLASSSGAGRQSLLCVVLRIPKPSAPFVEWINGYLSVRSRVIASCGVSGP